MPEEDVVKRGRGRPKKEKGGCVGRFTFHETEDSEYNRKSLEKELGLNGGEVIREALEMLYMIKIGSKQQVFLGIFRYFWYDLNLILGIFGMT